MEQEKPTEGKTEIVIRIKEIAKWATPAAVAVGFASIFGQLFTSDFSKHQNEILNIIKIILSLFIGGFIGYLTSSPKRRSK